MIYTIIVYLSLFINIIKCDIIEDEYEEIRFPAAQFCYPNLKYMGEKTYSEEYNACIKLDLKDTVPIIDDPCESYVNSTCIPKRRCACPPNFDISENPLSCIRTETLNQKKPKCPEGFKPALSADQTSIRCKSHQDTDADCVIDEYGSKLCTCPAGGTLIQFKKTPSCRRYMIITSEYPKECPLGFTRTADGLNCEKITILPFEEYCTEENYKLSPIECTSPLVKDPRNCYPRNVQDRGIRCPKGYMITKGVIKIICAKVIVSPAYYDCRLFKNAVLVEQEDPRTNYCVYKMKKTPNNVIPTIKDISQRLDEKKIYKRMKNVPFTNIANFTEIYI